MGEGDVLDFRIDVEIAVFGADGAVAASNVGRFERRVGNCESHFSAVAVALVDLLLDRVCHSGVGHRGD